MLITMVGLGQVISFAMSGDYGCMRLYIFLKDRSQVKEAGQTNMAIQL